MRVIELPCFTITLILSETNPTGGSITSDLCSGPRNENLPEVAAYNAIESLILAHACAGIDVTTPAYIEGIETAVDAIGVYS